MAANAVQAETFLDEQTRASDVRYHYCQECIARLCMLPSATNDAALSLTPAPRCLASLNRILLENEEALLR